MPANMKWAKRPYRYGGRTVPGMFKNGGLPKAQSIGELWDPSTFGPTNPVPPEKRSWLGSAGTWLGNVFRPSHADLSTKYKGQYKNPLEHLRHKIQQGPHPEGPAWGTTTDPQREIMNYWKGQEGWRKRGGSFKKGGSTGPNGML